MQFLIPTCIVIRFRLKSQSKRKAEMAFLKHIKMKNKIILFRAKYSMLFFDALAWIVGVDNWNALRKESNTIYKLLKVIYK